jgi:hypothetical protein
MATPPKRQLVSFSNRAKQTNIKLNTALKTNHSSMSFKDLIRDYMTLPPESERTWKHHPILIDFEHDYEELEALKKQSPPEDLTT